jgi:hypothetical protein
LRVSLLHYQDKTPATADLSWEELSQRLTRHTLTPCAPCPGKDCTFKAGNAWAPVEYDGKRGNAHVVSMSVAVFDIDHVTRDTIKAIAQRVRTAGMRFLIHTTHCHELKGPEDGAYRLVMPLSRPALPAEASRLREQLIRELELPADKSTKDLNRIYFLPTAPAGGPRPGAVLVGGRVVEVDEVLARAKPVLALVPPPMPAVSEVPAADAPVNMTELRKALKDARFGTPEAAEGVRRVLAGEALASEGERDATIQRTAGALVFHTPQETPVEALLELMRVSLGKIPGPPPARGTWMDVAREKLERAKERRAADQATYQAAQAAARALMAAEADLASSEPVEARGVTPEDETASREEHRYTDEQLSEWYREQKVRDGEEFRKRWIIQKGEAFFVFCGGRYMSAIGRTELETSLPRDLARSSCALTRPSKDGGERMSTVKELLRDYSTVARKLEASLVIQKSYYDPRTQTFHEAVCPLRPIKPREYPEIQGWLELLGGAQKDKLLDWVANVMRLDRQMAALIFHAVPSVGKNLFSSGLSRLWSTGGPSKLDRVFESFNDTLTQNPFIFADEKLPDVKGITAKLRELIGTTTRELNRKYMPIATLTGAVRLVVAGNNDRLFDKGEELSNEDLAAIAMRFLYVRPDPRAEEYLKAIGGPPVLQRWIDGDMIAAHALWLRETRRVNESARFLVQGESVEFHQHLITSSGYSAYLTEFAVSWLSDHNTKGQELTGAQKILAGEGALLIATEAFTNVNAWDARVPSQKVPSATRAGRALSNLSRGSYRILLNERQHKFHLVNAELLLAWAERAHVGDVEEMKRRIAQPNPLLKAVKERYGIR